MKSQTSMNRVAGSLAWLLWLAAFLFTSAANATNVELQDVDEQVSALELTVGKSHIIRSRVPVREVMLGNPDVADIKLLTSQKILILGKKSGRTNLVFRDRKGQVLGLFDVEVGYDTLGLKTKLHAVMPNEKGIEVRSANNKVVMSGNVSSLLAMDRALALARTFVSNDKDVINLLQVGGAQQVMLEVRIAEVARSSARALGTEFLASATGDLSLTLTTSSAASNAFGTLYAGGSDVNATLSALATEGLAKVLAEPNLVALSGSEAKFLAGGEFPVPIPQEFGGIAIEYKEFGVAVNFTPTVLDDRRINLKLAAESSEIDTSTPLATIEGADVPGITTRRAATTVELGDGQGFAIAGLLQNNMNNALNKLPGLGDVPVLGPLFRSTDFQRNETELVIVVVPRLVKPVPADRLALPTDNIVPPSELDQYIHGRLEAGQDSRAGGAAGETAGEAGEPKGLEGSYGHQL
jgi:pilus assembly protein CpaC